MTDKAYIDITGSGKNLEEAIRSICRVEKETREGLVESGAKAKLGAKVSEEYVVHFYIGNNPDNSRIAGKGKTYCEAIDNALETSRIKSIKDYGKSVDIISTYELKNPKEEVV